MQPLLNIATTAARCAGEIILRHMELTDRIKVTEKGHNEWFSEVDVKCEQAIINTIHKAYPDHSIMAEESGMDNRDPDYVWIIDPLDGTNNYLHGFPFFAVSIACKIKNRIEHAVVYDPLRHECFSATRGRGAKHNDRRIRVSKQTQLSGCLLATGLPVRNPALFTKYLPAFNALMGQCAGIRRTGSAALDMAYVACGRLDGFWEMNLRPWDIAAGSLLISEAGGLISDLQGSEDYLKSGNVVAAPPKLFKALLQTATASVA